MKGLKHTQRGFTLLEFMAVVVILGVLISVSVPMMSSDSARSDSEGAALAVFRLINDAYYKASHLRRAYEVSVDLDNHTVSVARASSSSCACVALADPNTVEECELPDPEPASRVQTVSLKGASFGDVEIVDTNTANHAFYLAGNHKLCIHPSGRIMAVVGTSLKQFIPCGGTGSTNCNAIIPIRAVGNHLAAEMNQSSATWVVKITPRGKISVEPRAILQ